ncbi:MAG: extracellular solute-binding protein [Candidatus Marinimicrobia bacterium]|nr:extracellular solute-binding protein [Candidatus Neomarinimicrobiota bacterium]
MKNGLWNRVQHGGGGRTRRRAARIGWGLLLAGLAVAVGGLPAPSRAATEAQDKGRILLRMQALPMPTDMRPEALVARQIVREFNAQFPQYKIERFTFPELEGMGQDQGPLMAITTGVPPLGIYVNFRQSSTYVNHGFLVPLEVLVARLQSANPLVREADAKGRWLADPTEEEVAAALEAIRERVPPSAWEVVYRRADTDRSGVPKGHHVWAMPYDSLVKALLYRKDVFSEAGLDPERPPRTWDEMLDYSRRIRALPGKFGFVYATGVNVSYSVYSFMVANGVRYMAQDETGRWRATFNTPAAAETIYYLLELTRGQFETADGQTLTGTAFAPLGGGREMGLKWNQGEIGMQFSSLSFERGMNLNPALTGIAPVPNAPSGLTANEMNARMMGVFSGASPEQQLGVMRYIWFLTGDRAEEIRVRTFVEEGYGEYLRPKSLERFGYDDILRRIPPAWRETMETALASGVPEPYGRNTQLIYQYVSDPINWALERPELLNLPREDALARIQEQLDAAAVRVDKFMLGELTPEEWRTRRLAGGTLLFLIIAIFVTAIGIVWRAFARNERALGDAPAFSKVRVAYFMNMPCLLLVLITAYLPLILGVPLALFDFQLVLESRFVGLDNFATILYDARFWASMGRTFYYVLLVLGLGFWPPILVAILLDEVPTDGLKYFFRTIFYLPTIVSGIIMVFLWRQFYEPSEAGFLNQIIMSVNYLGPTGGTILKLVLLGSWLSMVLFILACAVKLEDLTWPVRGAVAIFALVLLGVTFWPLVRAFRGPDELVIAAQGLDPALVSGWTGLRAYVADFFGPFNVKPLGWIEDPGMAMVCVVIPMVWASAGPGCIIYLAALKTVPEDLIEAAVIDGAGLIQRISYITLPRVKFLIMIQLMGAAIGAFKGGTNFIMVMTGGGPSGATRNMGLDIFQRAWMELKFSEGAAMGWVLGAIVIILTCQHLLRMSRAAFTTAGQAEAAKQNG